MRDGPFLVGNRGYYMESGCVLVALGPRRCFMKELFLPPALSSGGMHLGLDFDFTLSVLIFFLG